MVFMVLFLVRGSYFGDNLVPFCYVFRIFMYSS